MQDLPAASHYDMLLSRGRLGTRQAICQVQELKFQLKSVRHIFAVVAPGYKNCHAVLMETIIGIFTALLL